MSNKSIYIGIDIGGTNTRVGLFQFEGIAANIQVQTLPTNQSYEQQLESIGTAIQSFNVQKLAGIGISIAGRIAKDGRSVIVAPNLPAYVDQPLAQDISDQCNCPVRLAHDPVCGLLAETQFGSLQRLERCAYLTVSTGTGAAILLHKGSSTLLSSIEIGHQILDGNTRRCLCGQMGCLETFTGGKQLELRHGWPLSEIKDPAFWDVFCDKLALGLVNLAMLTRIDAVTMGGAIALNNAFLLLLLQQKVNALLLGATLALHLAALGENAPLMGAGMLPETSEEFILH